MPLLIALAVGALALAGPVSGVRPSAANGFAPGAGLSTELGHPGPVGGSGALTASTCAGLISNATLNTSVNLTYQALSSLAKGGGPNGTGNGTSVNLSAYPTVANASLLVRSWWLTVCLSSPFSQALQAWGPSNVTLTTGVSSAGARWNFGIDWLSPCTIPNLGSFAGCQYGEIWTGSLPNGTLSGPTTTASPPCGALHCPVYVVAPRTTPSAGSPFSSWSAFLSTYGTWVVGLLTVAVAVLAVAAARRPSSEAAPSESPAPQAPGADGANRGRDDPLRDSV